MTAETAAALEAALAVMNGFPALRDERGAVGRLDAAARAHLASERSEAVAAAETDTAITDEQFWAEVLRRVVPAGLSKEACATCRQLAEQYRAHLARLREGTG